MSEHESKIKAGITLGDINGVGPEVIMKTFSDNRMLQLCTPVIYGSSKTLSLYRKTVSVPDFNYNTVRSVKEVIHRKINLVNCWEEEIRAEPGTPSQLTGRYALQSVQAACADIVSGFIDIMITAPLDKSTVPQDEVSFRGHTEYLAEYFKAEDHLMFLVSGKLRIALVTGHVPLAQVPSLLSKEKIQQKLKTMHASLKRDFGIRKPKIAVLGLNPHAGDNGLIGKEDDEIIGAAIRELPDKNIVAFGPYSPDGIFGSGEYKKFDAILAMYHDQGLIPFKTIAFETGVNFTAGLPYVRTSPDHGTAYNIAGKGIALETSFREAVYLACDIYNHRQEYDRVNASPLAYSKFGGDR